MSLLLRATERPGLSPRELGSRPAELDGLKKCIELRANLIYLPDRDKNTALLQYEVYIHSAQSNEGQLSAGGGSGGGRGRGGGGSKGRRKKNCR